MLFYQEDIYLFCLSNLIDSLLGVTRLFQCGMKIILDSEVAKYGNGPRF